tara:strand:+ start:1329 stop:2516 length:1188 start_codon:yes stop_codon:yes gene_type:complete
MTQGDYSYSDCLDLLRSELKNTRFENEEVAVLSQLKSSGLRIPYVSEETYEKISQKFTPKSEKKPVFTFIDLFAGIGGFRLALSGLDGKSVFSSEWDKNAKSYYLKNYDEMPFGDINLFTSDEIFDNELGALIPSHDILAAGFPCQPFSLAGVSARNSLGKKHGFECTIQGTLFYSIERIVRLKKPKVLFLENVKNLINHDGGKTFQVIKDTIENLGFDFFYQIVNSETLVPQRRERCFMICVQKELVEEKGKFEFPNFTGTPKPLSEILEKNPDPSYTISDKLWQGHIARSRRNKARGTGFTTGEADLSRPSNTIVARYGKDGKECLIPQAGKNPRYLTIDECRRLFGYPENFKLPDARTPAYKLLGNSVVVPVVQRLASAIVSQYFSVTDKRV